MSTLTDDELAARLRSALQDVTPLAGDPVPAPEFLSNGSAGVGSDASADVVELDLAAPSRRRNRRRTVLAAGVLVAAAAVAGALVVTSHPPPRAAGTVRAASASPSASDSTDPDAPYSQGLEPYPTPLICTAPAGSQIMTGLEYPYRWLAMYTAGADTTCTPAPGDLYRFADGWDGTGWPGNTLAMFPGSSQCQVHGTGMVDGAAGFTYLGNTVSTTSRGENVDLIEFYGEWCRVVLPDR